MFKSVQPRRNLADILVALIPRRLRCYDRTDIGSWWRHQMETFSALLAICAGNSPVPGEFPAQRPVTRSFDVFFDLRLNKRLSKQSWGWGFKTLSRPLWRHCNVLKRTSLIYIMISFSFLSNQIVFNEMGFYFHILDEFVEIIYSWIEREGIYFWSFVKVCSTQKVGH